ncbi:hypothetical protein, partial [Glaesserella parasuis]|uniref:hypothetical protein n=1 Tax=Glaesserella parasuis TaxID=738 RepID=UPI003F382911
APVIEGLTPQEAIVETYRQHIAQLPALSQQMEQMASLPQQLAQELAGRDQHLVDAHYQISVLQAQVAALMELNSLALPEVDRGAIDAALRAG